MKQRIMAAMIASSIGLVGCSTAQTEEVVDLEMSDTVQSSVSSDSQSVASEQPQSVETPEEYQHILKILQDTAKSSPQLMVSTSSEIRDKAVNPVFEGELQGMRVLTLMALGAEPQSITKSGEFVAIVTLVKDGRVVATVECLPGESSIRPTSVNTTEFGDQLMAENEETIKTWATS